MKIEWYEKKIVFFGFDIDFDANFAAVFILFPQPAIFADFIMRAFRFLIMVFAVWARIHAYAQVSAPAKAPIDIHHVDLSIEVDPARRYINGRCTQRFALDSAARAFPMEFQLADDYIVSSISSNNASLYYYRTNQHLRIYPRGEWAPDDSVTIQYYGVPPISGLGSVVFDTHDNTPVFWTMSEPYGAMDWWPCRQLLDDKIDSLRIRVTCPAWYRSAANGVIYSDTVANGQRTTEWRHNFPIAYYLVGVSATNYRKYSDWLISSGGDSLEMVNYVYPEKYDQWRRRTYKIGPAYRMMCDSFGPYPFAGEKYGQAQFGWKGGIEHQTMTFLHAPNLDLMIHELAHQWFGNMITCSSWNDVFLNEAFATYCELLATEKGVAQSSDPVQWRRVCINKAIRKSGESLLRSNVESVDKIFDTDVVYSKGAMMLHMLRKEIGDHIFFSCMKSYAGNPLLKYGNATAQKFIETVEIVSGRKLDWFFGQWLYGAGIPRYSIRWKQQGDGHVSLVVDEETSGGTGKFMRAKIALMLHGTDGEKTLFVLNHSVNHQHFTINPKFRVSDIEFDPYCDLLSLGAEVEMKKK